MGRGNENLSQAVSPCGGGPHDSFICDWIICCIINCMGIIKIFNIVDRSLQIYDTNLVPENKDHKVKPVRKETGKGQKKSGGLQKTHQVAQGKAPQKETDSSTSHEQTNEKSRRNDTSMGKEKGRGKRLLRKRSTRGKGELLGVPVRMSPLREGKESHTIRGNKHPCRMSKTQSGSRPHTASTTPHNDGVVYKEVWISGVRKT